MPYLTYDELDVTSLSQGDVIARTPAIEALLEKIHPHYFRTESYRFFVVLTQSCDLVRRVGSPPKCKSRYITLAAVRPLALAVGRELEEQLEQRGIDSVIRITEERTRAVVRQFVERMLNNNEDDFFFLTAAPETGLSEDHCAFLRLSIAVRAQEHYDTILKAKILQLTEPFQHKLGYLVGKAYSRVATEDWVPRFATQQEFDARVTKIMRECIGDKVICVAPHEYVKFAAKAAEAMPIENPEGLYRKWSNEIREDATKERESMLKQIATLLQGLGVEREVAVRFKVALQQDPTFKKLLNKLV